MPRYAEKHLKKAERFIEAAEHDFNDDFFDTAVSHAYYAMHHAAKAMLLLLDESPKTHAGVINVLLKKVGELQGLEEEDVKALGRAFNRRVEVDYAVELEPPEKEVAEETLLSAREFVLKAKKIVVKEVCSEE